ncbi:P-loop NTPase [Mucilaginibacter paludis]|uniref:Novel STAND NTPase 5 domain-containing protein n=1 Tax=Mucilaginibacter paludis DSM 18603 TaxID=714943 RepID=H1YDS5_9SPHI|nr:hypothetical protein [Mucilaginibacter paludis]EHQ24265.1 hypothetical protein Mucpa_0062 [Mucilaginibacter paludis DSM 18603]
MITDREWAAIKSELKKNFDRLFITQIGVLKVPFEEVIDTLRSVLEKELGEADLDDRDKVVKALKVRYKDKDVDNYGTAVTMLALKLESFFKRVYKIINEPLWTGEQNMLKGQIVTFVKGFKYTYADPLFASADDTVFSAPHKEFVVKDNNNVPLFQPNYFITKFPFGKQFKLTYDLRNKEGHLDPETDDDEKSLLIKEIVTIYLFITYQYIDRLKQKVVHQLALNNISNWNVFKTLCAEFNRRQAYFLVIDRLNSSESQLSNLANWTWDFVFDLDSTSDTDGVLHAVKPKNSQAINQIIHHTDDRGILPPFPDKTTFWYFLKGNHHVLKSMILSGNYSDWRETYGMFTSRLMVKFYQDNFGAKSTIINVIILSTQAPYVKDLLYAIKGMDGKLNVNFIFANEDNTACFDLIDEIKGKSIDVPIVQLLEGFHQLDSRPNGQPHVLRVPCISNKGQSIEIPAQTTLDLKQYFKIVHLDILTDALENVSDKTFYQGRNIEWVELDNNYDVTRDITKNIHDSIRSWLHSRSDSGLFTLVHHPGSGGTTIARRIAFMLYRDYPVLLLNEMTISFDETKITDRLHQLFTLTELPALVIIDNTNIGKAQIQQLKRTIEHRLVKAIILTIESGFDVPQKLENAFYLKPSLEKTEVNRFLSKFIKEFPAQEAAFKQIIIENNPAILTPFYFGLIAYEEAFITIENYVKRRLAGITTKEKDLILLLAFFNYYAKGKSRDVPHFVISNFLGVDENFIRLRNHIDNSKILDLIIETEPDQYIYWRTIHPIISLQILKDTFEPNLLGALNPSILKIFAMRIIRSVREITNFASAEILQLLDSVFIQRKDWHNNDEEIDEDNGNGDSKFSLLISDLQTNQSRIEVFEVLTTEFPTEHAHFWGHFSRLYSIDKDFDNAIRTINVATDLDPNDYRLFHIKGMCYRTELYRIRDKYYGLRDEVSEEILTRLQQLFDDAEFEFDKTAELAPFNEHGYVAFVQMAIQTIEFGYSISLLKTQNKDYTQFITNPANTWYSSILASAKEWIDRYNNKNFEIPSQHLERYKIILLKFWGEKERMINAWQSLIGDQHHDQNIIRRNLAYAHLAKGDFDWAQLRGRDLLKIQSLASENLEGTFDARDLNLWFEVSRRLNTNVALLVSRLEELEFKIETIHSAYYLMCLYAIKVLTGGSGSALDNYEKNLQRMNERISGPYNKIFCPEWLGFKDNSIVLVNNKDIGRWNKEKQFFEDGNHRFLYRVNGKVVKYNRPQEGFIEIAGSGILVIYQPGKFGHYHSDAEKGTLVECYIGFNFDGARAFQVSNI